MDKKSKLLIAIVTMLILISILITFWRIMIKRDYIIENQIDCDPTIDACFIWECDPESTVEGEACTGDPEMDSWYYQIARRNAAKIPMCDPEQDETCDPWTCEEGEKDCSMTFCDETTKEEQGVECNDPVQYNIDNPEEEASACEEGDEACLAAEEESECAEDDEECLAAEEESECEEGDEECLAAEEEEASECEEGDEECLAAEEEDAECAEDDAECLAEEEEADTADATEEDDAEGAAEEADTEEAE